MINPFIFFKEMVKVVIFHTKGEYGNLWRYNYWKKRLHYLGENVVIETNVYFENPSYISIGNNVWIDKNVVITAGLKQDEKRKFQVREINDQEKRVKPGYVILEGNNHIVLNTVIIGFGGVTIGKNSTIGSSSCIYSISHHYRNVKDESDNKQYMFGSMVPPEDQFMIYGPVLVEENCGIGVCSVLFPGAHIRKGTWIAANSVVNSEIGPQKVLRNRNEKEADISHLKLPKQE